MLSTYDLVITHSLAGKRSQDIAALLNISIETVAHYRSKARKAGITFPPVSTQAYPRERIEITERVRQALTLHARHRGVTVRKLAEDIITTAALHGHIPTILGNHHH